MVLSSTAFAQNVDPKVADRFAKYDVDQDDLISHPEFMKGPFGNKGEPRGVVDRMFRDIDRDRDGFLTLREYSGAKRDRDRMRGKPAPEEPEEPEAPISPELVTQRNPDGSLSGEWGSVLLEKTISCDVRLPNTPGDRPVVVYLKGLPTPRIGTVDDATLTQGFLDDGMIVIEADYESDRRARAPELLPEIDNWYGFLGETTDLPIDTNWIYVLPAGYTIDRKVYICDINTKTVEMDVFHPAGLNVRPVPLMLQISSLKDQNLWINQRAYYVYGLLTHGYAGAVMEHLGNGTPKSDVFPEKQAARLLRAEATKWNLSGKLAVTGHSKGSSRAAKAAYLNDGEKEGDLGPHADQSDRFQAVLLSAGQHATEFLIEDGYLDEVGAAKRAQAEEEFKNSTLEELQEVSTLTYVTPDDPPAFLCVGELDKQFRVNQMTRLANKCREVGLTYQFVIQPDMPHQYIDDPDVIDRIFSFLDLYLK
ncbi:MAG: prolyl oligopeptidase family serine peptidase [Verrucomicrobiota bacterium]